MDEIIDSVQSNVPYFLERAWYIGMCNAEEIDRILKPKTAWDFLLKKRADIIADHPRYMRVFLHLSEMKDYSGLESYFSDRHYKQYISLLSKQNQLKCQQIAYGDIFSNDLNGYASYDEKAGTIIYLNESLKYYNFFMNLALLEFKNEVPNYVRVNALRIAIRISMEKEAMDFLLDPRGTIPQDIIIRINDTVKMELQYIAGHEFAHYLCGHFDRNKLTIKTILSSDDGESYEKVYNISQRQEFEADLYSIKNAIINKKDLQKMLRAALIWFSGLEMIEYAQDIISPKSSFAVNTHPSAAERYNSIMNAFDISSSVKNEIDTIRKRVKEYKDFLMEDISLNYNEYDLYGSVYLDEPNTEWRGRELIDRVDY